MKFFYVFISGLITPLVANNIINGDHKRALYGIVVIVLFLANAYFIRGNKQ